LRSILIASLLAVLFLFGNTAHSNAAGRTVVLVHGWNGSPSSWNTAKSYYEANGDTVHVLSLPKNSFFMRSGDAVINAKYIQSYIQQNNLTNVVLDGHSLGAMESLYVATVLKEPRVTSVVMRDTGFISGTSCWLIPDLCTTSAMASAIRSAANSPLPIFHANNDGVLVPNVDCTKQYSLDHNAFQTNVAVNTTAVNWPASTPCGSP